MKTHLITLAFLTILLASCAPMEVPASPMPTPMPTATHTLVPPTTEPTEEPPTPIPTQTPFLIVMTPDAVQLEHWKEYQRELAKVLMVGYGADWHLFSLCEWDILGRSAQKIYVWAYCGLTNGPNGKRPAVINLDANGSIQNIETPRLSGEHWSAEDLQELFPAEVREKFGLYSGESLFVGRLREMMDHIAYRELHPGEPPLIVLSATPGP